MILSGIVEKIRKPPNFKYFFKVSASLLSLILLIETYTTAQEFGGNPPSVKWKQIDTKISRIIFPSGLDSLAIDVSSVVQKLAQRSASTPNPRKINIVLQHLPTYSNGYVGMAPFRSEFYLTPRQNSFELGSLPWHKTLALHEYRHVQQFNNFRKGISKLSYYLFGEEGQALANSIAVPDWFWEGDAVYQETLLSKQGRGRIPYFFNGYRSLWASEKDYSWMKMRNGSYRDYVPDHYQLGYLLVNYGYEKFGNDIWINVASDAAAFKSVFYPFQKAFEKRTGQSFKAFRQEAIEHYNKKTAARPFPDEPSRFASEKKHFDADELYPQWINDSTLVYLRSTFSHIPAFYSKNIVSGKEKKIRDKGVSNANYFAANKNHIVYASFVPDARWGWNNYESITVVDIKTGKEKRITKGKRYLSPAMSADSKRIVAVHANVDGSNNLHILDAGNGTLMKNIPARSNYVYTYPVFYSDNSIVSAVRNKVGEMALMKFNIETGHGENITPFTMDIIAFPSVRNDTVYFSKSTGNSDQLYAAVNGKILSFHPDIANNTTGSYLLTSNGINYAWSAFTSAGFHIYTGKGKLKNTTSVNSSIFPMHAPLIKSDFINQARMNDPAIKKYSSSHRLFNFHSWRPYFTDPEYSYSLVSNNILNTLLSEVYITYNRNERFKEAGALLSYAGWYPVISGGASYTFDRLFRDSANTTTWNEFNARLGVNIPLQFTKGAFTRSLNFGAGLNTKQVYYTGASKQLFNSKKFNYAELSFSAGNQQLRARQNIYPRFAQSLAGRYRQILNNYTAHQLHLSTNLIFPGIHRNHNVVIQLSYQQRDTLQQYVFPNSFAFSRGYPDIDYPRMWKAGANYHTPLFYPDFGFGNIIYLMRIRSNIFYDVSKVKSLRTGQTFNLDAAGVEMYFDTKWWNQLPISFGVRYSRLFDATLANVSPNQWEVVLPVNLLSR